MNDPLAEARLDSLARRTTEKVHKSRLSSRHKMSVCVPRRSRSVVNHTRSPKTASLRSKSETRVEENGSLLSTASGIDINKLLNEAAKLGKITNDLQNLNLSDTNSRPLGARPKQRVVVSPPTPEAQPLSLTPSLHDSMHTQNLNLSDINSRPLGARPKQRVVVSPPTPEAQSLSLTPSLHDSMRAFLPALESADVDLSLTQNDDTPQTEGDVSLNLGGNENRVFPDPLFHQPSAVIYEDEIWRNPTPLGSEMSDRSTDSVCTDEIQMRYETLNDQMVAITEEINEKNNELAASKIAFKSLKDDFDRLMEERDTEIEELSRQVSVLSREKEGNKRTNDLLALKIESISDLNRKLFALSKKHEETVAALSLVKIELEEQKAKRFEETEQLREELEVLVKSNRDKEEKNRALKQKVSRIKFESRTFLGSMERTTSSLSLNSASTDRVMALGGPSRANDGQDFHEGLPGSNGISLPVNNDGAVHEDDGIAPDAAHGRTRPSMRKMERLKALSFVKWPKFDVFGPQKMDEFIRQIESHVTNVYNQGIEMEEIAVCLHSELISGSLGDKYSTHTLGRDVNAIDGVLDALRACDTLSRFFNNHERFISILPGPNDDEASYMNRVAGSHDNLQIGPLTGNKRIRTIIQQFSRGLNLPKHVANMVRYCQSLDDAVATAVEELGRFKNTQLQQPNGFHSQNQQQQQQQQLRQHQQVPQQHNNYQRYQQPQQQQQKTMFFHQSRNNSFQQQQQQPRQQQHYQQRFPQSQNGPPFRNQSNMQRMPQPQQQQQLPMHQQQQPMQQQQQQQQQQRQQQPMNNVNAVTVPRASASENVSVPPAQTQSQALPFMGPFSFPPPTQQ